MSDTTLATVSSFFGAVGGRLAMVDGECLTHGPASVLVRSGAAWHCPACLEVEMASEARSMWLADRNATLMQAAHIPLKYIGQRFIATTPAQKHVRAQVRIFRDFILQERVWATLIMVGITGTGKTLLACEFGQSLIANASRSVRYITAAGMISEIQASYGREGKTEEGEILRFVQYDVLILDEIDAIRSTENANLLLTEIINRRYNEAKPVVVISNQPFDTLSKYVGERVYSRLHENAFTCAFTWGDMRRAAVAP